MSDKRLENLSDAQLIRIAKSEPDRIGLNVRIAARILLKAHGYRFIGSRIEYDRPSAVTCGAATPPTPLHASPAGGGQLQDPANIFEQEDDTMSNNANCKMIGCDKTGAFYGYCVKHFKSEYGIPYRVYMKQRTSKGELPAEVAERIAGNNNPVPEKQQIPVSVNDPLKIVDFTEHPELLAKLVKIAEANFRTVNNQILFMIDVWEL